MLRPWQNRLLTHLFARRADGKLRHRQALIGMARKNGKSGLSAGIALGGLIFGPEGGEVYSCAADRQQAGVVFDVARRMVKLDPDLSQRLTVYRDVIESVSSGSIYRALSSDAFTKEGLNPSLTIFDEVHAQPHRELWDVMSLAMGARPEPMMIGITTAGVRYDPRGMPTICYQLYEHGRRVAAGEVEDPSFFMAWWEPKDPAADYRDPKTWAEGNPGLGDLVALDDFESMIKRTPEAEFRTKRCDQWVASHSAWLPTGAREKCTVDERIPKGSTITLGFDGSFSNDSTALVAVSVEDQPLVEIVGAWERPDQAGNDWRVPIEDVEEAIRLACKHWQVREIVCDPARWARSYQILEEEGLPVVEYPQSPGRMVPATARFFEAVLNGGIRLSDDPRLARHLDNCATKTDNRGTRITKDSKDSKRKIDLAVSAVMAFDRAAFLAAQPVRVRGGAAFF